MVGRSYPSDNAYLSAHSTNAFNEAGFLKFILTIFLLLLVQTTSDWIIDTRMEIVAKCLILAMALSWITYTRIGNINAIVVLMLAGIVILQSGLNFEAKGFSRAAIAIVIIVSLFPVKTRYLFPILALCFFIFLQVTLRSRTLLLVLFLAAIQYMIISYDRRMLMTKATPIFLIAALLYIGYAFIGGSDIIHASSSNVSRSTILYAIMSGLITYPFGFPSLEIYDAKLENVAWYLFEADYRDPHNIFLSAAAWGGFPLLIYLYHCYWRFVSWVARRSPGRLYDCFLLSALAVYLSTATLSLSNFIFIILLLTTLAWRVRLQRHKARSQ